MPDHSAAQGVLQLPLLLLLLLLLLGAGWVCYGAQEAAAAVRLGSSCWDFLR
jgi:hypothetical protein